MTCPFLRTTHNTIAKQTTPSRTVLWKVGAMNQCVCPARGEYNRHYNHGCVNAGVYVHGQVLWTTTNNEERTTTTVHPFTRAQSGSGPHCIVLEHLCEHHTKDHPFMSCSTRWRSGRGTTRSIFLENA